MEGKIEYKFNLDNLEEAKAMQIYTNAPDILFDVLDYINSLRSILRRTKGSGHTIIKNIIEDLDGIVAPVMDSRED